MNAAGIRATIGHAPKADYIDFNFQDAQAENAQDAKLIGKLTACIDEVGKEVPGIKV